MIDKLAKLAGLLIAAVVALSLSTDVLAGPVEDFDVALKHYQARRFDLSAEAFSDFIRKNPTNERRSLADLYLGQSLMQLRNFQEARTVFAAFLKANPDHPDFALAMYREAECTFFLNDAAAAAGLFDAFLKKFPENELGAWGWYYLGESELRLKNPDKAAEAFQTGLTRFPKSQRIIETRFGLARAQASLKQYDKAAEQFRAIADDATNPRAPDALFELGSMEFDAGRFAEAAAAFSSITEKFPAYRQATEAAMNAGSSFYKVEKFDEAVKAFDEAARSPKDRLNARFWAAQSRRSQGKFDEAIRINREAYTEFKDDPNAARLLYYWGDCEYRKGDYAAAIPLFVQFVDTYPAHEFADDSLHYAVEAALKAANLDQAELLHQRFVREFPANRSGLTMLESILYGRILLARAEQLSPRPPLSAEARDLLTRAADTFESVAKASKIERTSSWATLLLTRARVRLGDWAGALAAAGPLNEKLTTSDKPSEFAESLYLTGLAASELQQWSLADTSFENYLKRNNDPANVAAALSQLVLARTKAGKIDQLEELWPRFTAAGVASTEVANALLAAAESAIQQQRFEDAAKLYSRLESMPDAGSMLAAARSGLGHARFNLNDFAAAAESFGKLTADPAGRDPVLVADAALMKGLSLEKAKQPEDAARAYYDGALLIAGQDGRLGNPPANARVAIDALRCMKAAASQFEALNNIARANEAYSQAWEYQAKLPQEQRADQDKLLFAWARANYVAKKYDKADELYGRLLRDHPMSSFADDAAFFLAESMVLSGKSMEAEAELKRLLELPTTDEGIRPEILHNLIELAANGDRWAAAQDFSSQLLDRYPSSSHRANAKYRLAEASLQLKELEKARTLLAELRQAIAASATAPEAEYAEGIWILSAEAELASSPANHPEIDRLTEEFHTKFPQSPLLYQIDFVHGRSLLRRAPVETEKGRAALQTVIDSTTGGKTETAAMAALRLAETYTTSGKAEEYPAAYRKFFDVAVRYEGFPQVQSSALLKAADVQEKMGKKDGAIDTYRELISRFPMSSEANDAKARLKALGADETPKPASPAADEPMPAPVNPKGSSVPGNL